MRLDLQEIGYLKPYRTNARAPLGTNEVNGANYGNSNNVSYSTNTYI